MFTRQHGQLYATESSYDQQERPRAWRPVEDQQIREENDCDLEDHVSHSAMKPTYKRPDPLSIPARSKMTG